MRPIKLRNNMSSTGNKQNIRRRTSPLALRGSLFLQVYKTLEKFSAFLFFGLIALILYEGWEVRGYHYLEAKKGMGYALGIIGGIMMLLLYPLRKRFRSFGSVKHCFRIHMVFGILGPTLILFHSNFSLGAINSHVAFFSMSIVAASGLLGRYFYSRIHHGLYGSQVTLRQLQDASHWHMMQLTNEMLYFPHLQTRLKCYEKTAFKAGRGWFKFVTLPWLAVSSRLAYLRLWSECKQSIHENLEDKYLRKLQLQKTRLALKSYFREVRRAAGLRFYERLFSAWHIFHPPLFIMMLVTGVIHVIAVHVY